MRKQDHVSNRFGSRQYHDQAVYTDPDPTGGRHPVFERQQKIFVDLLNFFSSLLNETLPLNDTMAFRVSGFTREDPGYVDNVRTGEKGINMTRGDGGRLSFLWRPSAAFSLTVRRASSASTASFSS